MPQPGRVKTRLAATIGSEHAVALYQCFVQDVLATLHLEPTWDLLIFYAPAEAAPVPWLGEQYRYVAQQGQDLGERMAHGFRHAFSLGYASALILGSDSPDLPWAYVQQACQALANEQVVIGPSQDGGYYTLGFTRHNFEPTVFAHMPWSTATVFTQTCDRLAAQSGSVLVLPTWFDIDTLADLRQFYHRAQKILEPVPSHTLEYLRQHPDVLAAA